VQILSKVVKILYKSIKASINGIKTLTEIINSVTEAVKVSINGIKTPADIIKVFIKSVQTPVELDNKYGEPNSLIQWLVYC
jgi:hypothetical protein